MTTRTMVQKLWHLCHILRDDGITYHQYVTELTYLLFLKMACETGTEEQLPTGYRWHNLARYDGPDQLEFYQDLLAHLGRHGSGRVQAIFAGAATALRSPRNLQQLVAAIHALDWYSAPAEGLGDMYEGLLQKNASELKAGAGQYFTPRPLVECMVAQVQPRPGELIEDPAAGTGGFLVAADRYIKERTQNLAALGEAERRFQQTQAYTGLELVRDTHRLALMNLMLHDIQGQVLLGDTLSAAGAGLPPADVMLTNPPFGAKKGGGGPTRSDLPFPTANKQLAFLQHIYRGLKPGGRAAVVVPDNVLFEESVGAQVRTDLLEQCHLHTLLRLPTGIFYAQGVKTNVLFFTRGTAPRGNTPGVWVYDLRTQMPAFGKRNPLARRHFAEFEAAFGPDPCGRSLRIDQGEQGRFRYFSREQIAGRGDNLDITWLRSGPGADAAELPTPGQIAAEIMADLDLARREIAAISAFLAECGDGGEP